MNANHNTKKIEMTKTESKAAGKIGTDEYNALLELMKSFPGYQIEIKASAKRNVEFKGLDYKYMKNYIQKSTRDDKDSIMEEFATLIAQDKKDGKDGTEHLEAASYLDVKKWFLAVFPEIKQFREDHQKQIKNIMSKIPA